MSSGKGSSGYKSYQYFGSFAAVWHVGQMDRLTGFIINDKLVWDGSLLRTSSTNPVEITIPNRGIYRHYWGTRDQLTVDPILLPAGNDKGHTHPARTGNCWGICDDFLLGKEVQNAPSIRLRGERTPVQSLITGDAAVLSAAKQANPFCVLAELMTDEWFGLAMSADLFAAAQWQAAADLALTKHALCYVSPFIDAQQSVRAIAQNLFFLCDGFLRAEAGTGLCEAGLFTAPEDVVLESLTTISQRLRLTVPRITPGTWDDVETSWDVKFRDRDYDFKVRSMKHRDPGAVSRVGDVRPADLDRPAIVIATQALNHAREWGRRHSTPGCEGTQRVRAETIPTLRPGEHAIIDVQVEPDAAADLRLCRVLGIDRTIKDGAEVKFEAVRTAAPVASGEVVVPDPPEEVPVPCIDVTFRAISLPRSGDDPVQLAILASRPSEVVTSFAVHFDPEEDGSYQRLGSSRGFALRCTLATAITDTDAGALEVTILDEVGRELIQDNPGTTGAADDEILVVLLKLDGSNVALDGDGLGYMEIMSASEFTIGVDDALSITALRNRLGTDKRAFAEDDEVWIVRRSRLTIFTSGNFTDGATGYFRLEPATSSATQPECTPLARLMPPPPSGDPDYDDLVFEHPVADIVLECRHRAGIDGKLTDQVTITSPGSSLSLTSQAVWAGSNWTVTLTAVHSTSNEGGSGGMVKPSGTGISCADFGSVLIWLPLYGPGSIGGSAVQTGISGPGYAEHVACLNLVSSGGTSLCIPGSGAWSLWTVVDPEVTCDGNCVAKKSSDPSDCENQEAEFRVTRAGLNADANYYLSIQVYRRPIGSSDGFGHYETLDFVVPTDGAGNLDFTAQAVPNLEGWETCVGAPELWGSVAL